MLRYYISQFTLSIITWVYYRMPEWPTLYIMNCIIFLLLSIDSKRIENRIEREDILYQFLYKNDEFIIWNMNYKLYKNNKLLLK